MTSLSIPLNDGFSPKVKIGDKVVSGQVIAEKSKAGVDHEVHLSKILNISPEKILKHLLKKPGDRVDAGMIIAVKKGALGMGGKKAISPVAGTVFKFDESSGILTIRSIGDHELEDIFSPVDGEVTVCDNEQIVLITEKGGPSVQSATGEGKIDASLYVLSGEDTDPADIKIDIKGKVAVGRNLDREVIAKSLGLGAVAILAENIREEYLKDLRKRMIKTPIFVLNKNDIEKFLRNNGRKVYIDMDKKTVILQNE